ncbi:hypothetical protein [uncultured Hymenobacter sp.]|uniref:hypothetical protein n=1 Tax=uncultured Hymenobacter sp. TaxID=170016 RepID=UPI0035CA0C6C
MNLFNQYGNPSTRHWLWLLGTSVAFGVEVLFFTILRGYFGPYYSPIWFYLASVLLCVCALLTQLDQPVSKPGPRAGWHFAVYGAVLLFGGAVAAAIQYPVIAANPIDVAQSDVIPILQNYVGRFRSGEIVYRYITNLPYPLFPNHLPLQWLPYVPADKLSIDYRWWSLGILVLGGFGAYLAFLNRQALRWIHFVLLVGLPWLLLCFLIVTGSYMFSHTVEFTIIAYYCLLTASIFIRSAWLRAAALVLCLLSRYSVIFWVPLFLWILWRETGRRHAVAVALLTGLGIVLVYVVPFLSKDWTIFTHALNEYRVATLGEWTRTDATNEGGPVHLFSGLGFASFFYTYGHGEIADRISLLQKVHVLVSLAAVTVSGFVYWKLRRRVDYRVLALIALKFYLATFYAFLQIPYAYLTSMGLFISVFVVVVAFREPKRAVVPSA